MITSVHDLMVPTSEPLWVLLLSPLLTLTMGCAYMFGNPGRTATPSFDAAKSVADMPVWGAVFFAAGVLTLTALATSNRIVLALVFWAAGFLFAWWSVCFLVQAFVSPLASLNAWTPYALISIFHFHSAHRFWMPTP